MRKIILEITDGAQACKCCNYHTHIEPAHLYPGGVIPVCTIYDEQIIDYKPCVQCLSAGRTKHVLIYMDGGIPQSIRLVSGVIAAEEFIRSLNDGCLPEDADVAEQMREGWGRVDITEDSEVYIVPFNEIQQIADKPEEI